MQQAVCAFVGFFFFELYPLQSYWSLMGAALLAVIFFEGGWDSVCVLLSYKKHK